MTQQELAQHIVSLVLKDLKGRRGFRHIIESIELEDEEIWTELQQDLINIVENAMIHNEN